MTAADRQAVDVRPPMNGEIYVYTTGTSHGVELVPFPLLRKFSTWAAQTFKAYLVFGTAATIEADRTLTASVITAADTDAIKLSIATSASEQTYVPAQLDGTVGDDPLTSPTLVSVTGNGNAHINATTVIFTCLEWGYDSKQITVEVPVTNDLSGTVYGVTAYDSRGEATSPYIKQVLSIYVPPQGGTSGAFEFGLYERVAAAVNACVPIPADTAVNLRIPYTTPFFSHEADGAGKLVVWPSSGSGA